MDLNPIGWGAVGFSFSSAAWVVRGVKFQGWAGKIHFSLTPGAWKNIESCWIAQRSSSRLRTQHGQPANTCRLVQNLSMADELDPDVEYILLNKPLGDWIFAHDFALALVRIWCTLLASLCLRIFVDICSVCTEGMFSSLLAGRQAILLFSFGCCFCLPIFHVLRRDAKVYQAGSGLGCSDSYGLLAEGMRWKVDHSRRFRLQHQRQGTRLLTGRSEWHLRRFDVKKLHKNLKSLWI